jgi:hypothetical protein
MFGGAIVAGVATAVISAYEITDCLRFQTRQGQCSGTIQQNALPLVAGLAAVLGPIGGFFTLNTALGRQPGESTLARSEPGIEPEPAGDAQAQAAWQLRAEGMSQRAIAEQLGISRSAVQRLLSL